MLLDREKILQIVRHEVQTRKCINQLTITICVLEQLHVKDSDFTQAANEVEMALKEFVKQDLLRHKIGKGGGFSWNYQLPDWTSGRLRALLNSTAPEHILSMQLHTFCLDMSVRLFGYDEPSAESLAEMPELSADAKPIGRGRYAKK